MHNTCNDRHASKQLTRYSILFFTFIYISLSFAGELDDKALLSRPENSKLSLAYSMPLQMGNYGLLPADSKTVGTDKAKSRGKAFLFSLMLPGAGEYYIGENNTAKVFFITEIVLWTGYFAFDAYHNWKRDDMYVFAATHSGAQAKGKPAQYFVDIGNYDNIYDYNDAKQRQREFYKVYPVNEDYNWEWDSNDNRDHFEKMRISSDKAYNRAIFTIGGIIANHVVSAIDAVWQTHRHNKKLKHADMQLRFRMSADGCYTMSFQQNF